MKNTYYTLICITILNYNFAFAQEHESESSKEKVHKIGFVFGYTHIPAAFEAGDENRSVFVPTIGVDYFVHLDNGWKLGAILDLELGDYLVKFNRNDLKREKALVTGILVGYEFDEHWSLSLGPGIEFEKNKNLFILRSSLEYEFELDQDWGLFPAINYDFKQEYSTWSINLGICKRF